MKVSFVIVNYNRKNELLITIGNTKQLIKTSKNHYEIVVVDNASDDGSASALKAEFPEVILIENHINTGAPAWNIGFERANGDYFIILDDDSHIEYGLEEALAFMEKYKDIGVLALNVTNGPYTSKMWGWEEEGQDTVGFIGCGAILRRETYQRIGGYADWIFLYVNEWEYGLRCIDAGYHVKFFANSRVNHRASAINRSSKRLRVFVTKHELGIIYKHFSVKRWKYIFRAMINNLKIIKSGQFKNGWYNLIGIIEFLKMRKSLSHTPVSAQAQNIFIVKFDITKKSAFGFIFEELIKKFKA